MKKKVAIKTEFTAIIILLTAIRRFKHKKIHGNMDYALKNPLKTKTKRVYGNESSNHRNLIHSNYCIFDGHKKMER